MRGRSRPSSTRISPQVPGAVRCRRKSPAGIVASVKMGVLRTGWSPGGSPPASAASGCSARRRTGSGSNKPMRKLRAIAAARSRNSAAASGVCVSVQAMSNKESQRPNISGRRPGRRRRCAW